MKYIFNSIGAGRYCDNGRIPHEVINFFKADDGWYYGYIAPHGTIGKKKWKKGEKKCVILYISKGNKKLQLIAQLPKAILVDGKNNENLPKYKGVRVDKIFDINDQKETTKHKKLYITFKYKKILIPEEPTCINSYYYGKKINNQSLKAYFDKNIVLHCKWKKSSNEEIIDEIINTHNKKFPNILEILRKQDDENAVSNLIAHYLNNLKQPVLKHLLSKLFKNYKFAKLKEKVVIKREEPIGKHGRADFYIETEKQIIIIENKIWSDFGKDQIKKYKNYILESKKMGEVYSLVPDFSSIDNPQYTINYSHLYKILKDNKKDKSIVYKVLLEEINYLRQKFVMNYFKQSIIKFHDLYTSKANKLNN